MKEEEEEEERVNGWKSLSLRFPKKILSFPHRRFQQKNRRSKSSTFSDLLPFTVSYSVIHTNQETVVSESDAKLGASSKGWVFTGKMI